MSAAPAVTTSAAATIAGRGRECSSSGPPTASSGGTQATATPSTAGSAWCDPWTRPTLNSTRPVAAMPVSHSHSAPRGQTSRRPARRANTTSSRQAAAYRTASAVYIGAPASTPETATLPPTNTMPEMQQRTARPVLASAAGVADDAGPGRTPAADVGTPAAGWAPGALGRSGSESETSVTFSDVSHGMVY